jgi:uncharacterized repeat protein (TIGR04138 family)
MKHDTDTKRGIDRIRKRDDRYKAHAYSFVLAAVEYTISLLPRPRHVSARELLEGIRRYGIEEFGPMAKQVFNDWGVASTEDFGNIVYNLIDQGLLSRTEEDRLEDFHGVYDFEKVFEEDYFRG